jgi:CheY-like chemotaxis protein
MVNARQEDDVRFNVLLTEDREHAIEHWTHQLPRLLRPQGIQSFVVRTGREALEVVGSTRIHAAVIDLSTPAGASETGERPSGGSGAQGGLWLLEVFRRLPRRPPVVVVNSMTFTPRDAQRMLNEALRLGAFSVINRPVELEALLAVIRRLVDREYRGQWPRTFFDDVQEES